MEPEFNDDITDELLIRFLYGEADAAAQARVKQWLLQQQDHKRYLEQLRFLQQRSRINVPVTPLDIDAEWQAFQTRIAAASPGASRFGFRTWKRRWLGVAAVLVILISLAGVLFYNNITQSPLIVKAGDRVLRYAMPDGSVVTLNKGAELRYKRNFNEQRSMTLSGEGFFEVRPDKTRPFVVTAAAVHITVVGTSFNVHSAPGRTEVIVETGKVEVRNRNKQISLLPHEKGIAEPGSGLLTRSQETGQLYNYYRSNRFICRGTRLDELVEALNAAYGMEISVPDPAKRALKITATYERTSFDEILHVVCSTLDLQAERKGRSIILK